MRQMVAVAARQVPLGGEGALYPDRLLAVVAQGGPALNQVVGRVGAIVEGHDQRVVDVAQRDIPAGRRALRPLGPRYPEQQVAGAVGEGYFQARVGVTHAAPAGIFLWRVLRGRVKGGPFARLGWRRVIVVIGKARTPVAMGQPPCRVHP